MSSYDAPDVPTAGEQIESGTSAYLNNQDALRDAARQDASNAFSLSSMGLTGVDPAAATWNDEMEALYQEKVRDGSAADMTRSAWLADAAQKFPNDSRFNAFREANSYVGVMENLAPRMDELTAESNTRQRTNDLRDVMGDAYDPNKSMAENISSIDRAANPEMYAAAEQISGTEAPTIAEANWADQNAYRMSNRDALSTSAWNRFDQNADTLRSQDLPNFTGYNRFDQNADALRGQPMAQMRNIDDPTWAMGEVYKDVYNRTGQEQATGDLNQIFNYSPEANRARQIIGQRLSDGGGENLAHAYNDAQSMRGTGTFATTETRARDNLLKSLGQDTMRAGDIDNVSLDVDNVGEISERERRDATQDARAGFNDRGRVRGTGAAVAEIMANEDARRARRQERNTNNLNRANVDLANAQNQLRAITEKGRQDLSRMGQADNILTNRFNQRLQGENSANNRLLQRIGALSGTDAQRFQNFQQGVNANMGIDADYQNRVDRYLGQEMQQDAFNAGENQRWLDNLRGIEGDWQNRQAFANQAAMQQDALRAGRLGEYERANADWMQRQAAQEESRAGRLGEYERASDNWNQRQAVDDAAARQRMQDYQSISSDWQQRQQQDFANQMQQGLAALGAWQGLRQDPWSSLTNRNSPNVNTNTGAWAQGNPQATAGNMGFADVMNLTNNLTNMGVNAENQANAANASMLGGLFGGLGSLGGAWLGG